MSRKRMLLLAAVVLLCAAALYALVILVVGRFGSTELRVVGTMAVLAGFSLLSLPSISLAEQGRALRLASFNAVVVCLGAVAAITVIWTPGRDTGRAALTAAVLAGAVTQSAGLLAHRRSDDIVVARLYAASVAVSAALAAAAVAQVWGDFDSQAMARLLGSLLVLDVLVVGLQPLLARLRPVEHRFHLRLTVDADVSLPVEIAAPDLATAAAKAIRDAEHRGERVRRVDVELPATQR